MKQFFDSLKITTQNNPNKIAFIQEGNKEKITYQQLEIESGKVYNYLLNKDIKKEDFVLIKLPRSFKVAVAMLGVLKAGAAFVIVEEDYAKERIDFIEKDSNAKFVIDLTIYEEMMTYDYLEGRNETSEHDACYAIYTSGSTGKPKGVLHEYGNIDEIVASLNYEGEALLDKDDIYPLMAPLNMMAGVMSLFLILARGVTAHIITYATLKNPTKLIEYFEANAITIAFFTPSMIKGVIHKFNSQLKRLILSSERASGIFFDNLKTYNFYCSSETGYIGTIFYIDKAYDNVPIGKNQFAKHTYLIDDNGTINNEKGELIIECPYTRPYINLEQRSKATFIDGYLHTGDIVSVNENGQYVVNGRIDDMIKINGNRIEPAEIEEAIKKELKINECIVKAQKVNNHQYICCYYKEEITFDKQELEKKLLKHLPYYMIPSYYIKMANFELLASGKVNKNNLPLPIIESNKKTYIAPRNELEKRIVEAYQQALDLDKVSIDDDFFELGGDSLSVIELISILNIPELSFAEIYQYKTPENIAKICFNLDDNIDDDNKICLKKAYPLTPYQTYMFDYQLINAYSTMNDLPVLLKIKKDFINPNILKQAFDKAMSYHPVFGTRFVLGENLDFVQRYNPSDIKPIEIEYVSDEEFSKIKDELVKPFTLVDSPLAVYKIYVTETSIYLFVCFLHVVSDGTSVYNFIGDILKCLNNQTPDKDYYYYYLKKIFDKRGKDTEAALSYYKNLLGDNTYAAMPKYDFEDGKVGRVSTTFTINKDDFKLDRSIQDLDISVNEALTCAELLMMQRYNKENDIMINWTYNGRNSADTKNICGLLISNLPVAINFNDKLSYDDLFKEVRNQIIAGMQYSYLSYGTYENSPMKNDRLTLYYEHGLGSIDENLPIENIDMFSYLNGTVNSFNIIIYDAPNDGLLCIFVGNSKFYKQESIEEIARIYKESLITIFNKSISGKHDLIF